MTDFQTHPIPRDLLAKYFGADPRLVSAFENQALAVMENSSAVVAATDALQDASVITLSANAAFSNEFILADGDGTRIEPGPGTVTIAVDDTVARSNAGLVTFAPPGVVTLGLPVQGTLLSDAVPAVIFKPRLDGLVNAASDAAAAAAGVLVGGVYHNAGALRIRLV